MLTAKQLLDIDCISVKESEWVAFLEARGMKRAGRINAFSNRGENAIYMKDVSWANATDGDAKDMDDKLCFHEWLHLFVDGMHYKVVDWKSGVKAVLQAASFGFDCRGAITPLMLRWGPREYLDDYWRFVDMLRDGRIVVREA